MDNTHGFERASLLRFVTCIYAAQPSQLAREGLRTPDVLDTSRVRQPEFPILLLPWRNSALSHRGASSKTRPRLEDRDNPTWQLLSEGATRVATRLLLCLLVVGRVSTRPQRAPQRGGEENQGIQMAKLPRSSTSDSRNFDLPAVRCAARRPKNLKTPLNMGPRSPPWWR